MDGLADGPGTGLAALLIGVLLVGVAVTVLLIAVNAESDHRGTRTPTECVTVDGETYCR